MRAIVSVQEPPGCCPHSGCTHVACGGEKMGVGGAGLGGWEESRGPRGQLVEEEPPPPAKVAAVDRLVSHRGDRPQGWEGAWGPIRLTPNCHVAEEEPAADEGLFGAPGGPVHDVEVWRVEAQGCGREPVRHQVHPQQLHGDQGLRQPQGSCQEDAARRRRSHVCPGSRACGHPSLHQPRVPPGWPAQLLTRPPRPRWKR